jgi:branched-chain amino acid transport system ATP-binding protein
MGGITVVEREYLMGVIREISKEGKTIFLIEHVMEAVMQLSARIAVLNYGELIFEGTPSEASMNEAVIAAYLGEEYHAARN